MPVLDPLSLASGMRYRIVTLDDVKKEPVAKLGKEIESGAPLSEGVERAGGRKRKLSNQKMEEDGEYHDEHDEDTDDCADETRALKNKRQKRGDGDGERDAGDGADNKTLTPRQMVALHWAGQDARAAAAKSKQAVVGIEETEDGKAGQGDGAKEADGAEVKVDTGSAGPVTGRLRNGKKRDIGRRLGGG